LPAYPHPGFPTGNGENVTFGSSHLPYRTGQQNVVRNSHSLIPSEPSRRLFLTGMGFFDRIPLCRFNPECCRVRVHSIISFFTVCTSREWSGSLRRRSWSSCQ